MRLFLLALVAFVLATSAAAVAYVAGSPEEATIRAAAVGLLTLLVAGGGGYLSLYTLDMKRLEAAARELTKDDAIRMAARAVHYKSGNPQRFWEAVGGLLVLGDDSLEFRANPREWWVYEIRIPLSDVKSSTACKIGPAPGGLRIDRHDGTFELFTFGAALDVSQEWAEAIGAGKR